MGQARRPTPTPGIATSEAIGAPRAHDALAPGPGDIVARRLAAQRLTGQPFATATEAVAWLGAVQAQDLRAARWAIGQRVDGASEAGLHALYDAGAILRTHVLRPTWHLVLPDDIRWLLDLTGPRIRAMLRGNDRRLEIDGALLRRSHTLIETALGGGTSLTRAELAATLAGAGIPTDSLRLVHLVMHAELDAIITSGPRRGRQLTYALLAERAPASRRLDRESALAELTLRYFASRGPAQAHDFAWWSGLPLADARRGLAAAGSGLAQDVVAGTPYWSVPGVVDAAGQAPTVHLLPSYDEFLVAYRDRSAALDPARGPIEARLPRGSILGNVVLVDGRVRGGWGRQLRPDHVEIELGPIAGLSDAEHAMLHAAVDRYARFLGLPATVVDLGPGPSPGSDSRASSAPG